MIEYMNVRRSHFICTEHNAHDEAKLVCIFQIQCHRARKTYSESSFQPFVYLQKELITSKGILTTLLFFPLTLPIKRMPLLPLPEWPLILTSMNTFYCKQSNGLEKHGEGTHCY